MPASHNSHVEALVASMAEDRVPAGHEVQELAPLPEYVPARQLEQDDAPSLPLYMPASHNSHVEALVASMAEDRVPAGHEVQELAPLPEYVPARQLEQDDALSLLL